MIVPSIDIVDGTAVQLVGGEERVIDAGDPIQVLEKFSVVGEVAVVDIDAARGEGDNRAVISRMCRMAPIRVGGGIRTPEQAIQWLDDGARRVVLGTAANPSVLNQLPVDRVIVALDARDDDVLTHGWRRSTGRGVVESMTALRSLCSGFLVTFVEREGRLAGTDLGRAKAIVRAAHGMPVTIAGGVTTAEEVAALDRIGADAQVGMALYNGQLHLADAVAATLASDRPDGLWPTVVVDEFGIALGLAWSDRDSLAAAITTRRGVYRSRARGLWVKGETSGATQDLLGVSVDCDRDALRFRVRQHRAGFCHTGTRSCWGEDAGLGRLERRLGEAAAFRPEGSNTVKLLDDAGLLRAKLAEEASELGEATEPQHVAEEAADLVYFALVKAISAGVGLREISAVLDGRERKVSRREMTA